MTLISDLLTKGPTFSFEFFPPKNDTEQATLVRTLRDLEPLSPSFVSVTYRGGRESRQRTFDLVTGMLRTTTLTPMAHLICVAHTRLELAEILVAYRKAGVQNLMALGGDPPEDPEYGEGDLAHASELVELAHAIGGWSIGVAAHPAGHPTSTDLASDRKFLAAKLRLARLRSDTVLLRGRRVPASRRRPCSSPGRQAGPSRNHARDEPELDSADGADGGGTAGMGGRASRAGRPGRSRRGATSRDRDGDGALRPPPRSWCAGTPLLHSQPLERDPRDLQLLGPGERLSNLGRLRRINRSGSPNRLNTPIQLAGSSR